MADPAAGELLAVPPKVLLISARSDVGGGPAHMFELAKGLNSADVFVAIPNDGHFYKEFMAHVGAEHVWEIPRQCFTVGDLYRLWLLCQRHKIDLIHSHGKGAGVYSRLLGILAGVPVVHTLHGYHDARYGFVMKRVYAIWETLAAVVTQKIICVSESERKEFSRKVCVAQKKRVTIQNGTPVQSAVTGDIIAGKVVTVARFDYAKNLLEFLQVAQRLPTYRFHLIGDGEERSEIERFLAENKVANVVLHGLSQTVVSDISDADVYLSTSRWEGLPMAVLEAMSLGIPVVASDVVGNRDAVKQSVTGYLYPLGDIAACVEAIEQARVLDRARIRKYHSDNFSSERMIAKTRDLYKRVLEARAA